MMRRFLKIVLLPVLLGLLACSRPEETTTSFIVDGLQVILKVTPGNPAVAGGFYLRGGTNYTGTQQAGIEYFLFEAAIQGTKSITKNELNARLESMGTTFWTIPRYDYTGLTFRCINDHFNSSWDLFTDVLLQPRFDPGELEIVRQRFIAAIEAEKDEANDYVRRIANDLFYEGHPYGVSIRGLLTTAARLSRKDLIQYHLGDITKNRALLVIVGDLDQQDVTRRARELARQLPKGPELRLPSLDFDPGQPDLAVARRDLPTNFILALFQAPRPGHPDYPAFTAAVRILSDRLVEELHTRRGLANNPKAGFDRRIANHGFIQVTTTQPNGTVAAISETVNGMSREPIPDKQLKNVLTISVTGHLLENESVYEQMDQLALWEIVGEDWEKANQYLPEIQSLRPPDIQNAMRKYVKDFHFGVLGDPGKINKSLFTSR